MPLMDALLADTPPITSTLYLMPLRFFHHSNALWGSPALFQHFAQSAAACPGSTSTENYRRFSPPPTNAFYPMTSQDTMRPFCLFSQIRARSHTNTNINTPSSEWATKYLVGNSHEGVFAHIVMIYCELDARVLARISYFLTWDGEKLKGGYRKFFLFFHKSRWA